MNQSSATGEALREQVDAALSAQRASEARLESELADSKLLQGVSAEIIQAENPQILYEKIMDAAVSIMRSDFASMQMLHPERGDGGELQLLACRGYDLAAAKFWEWVRTDSGCTCGQAIRAGRRILASDVQTCEFMVGTPDQANALRMGMRAMQSTPLVARSGQLVGMISTHWRQPHVPAERDLRMLDILARQAADLLERMRAVTKLRESEELNRSLMDGSPDCVKVLDLDGKLRHMNLPGLCLMEIDDFAPLCGKAWWDLWPAEAGEQLRRAVASARDGQNTSFEAPCPTAKGKPKWWEVTVSPVRDATQGRVVRLLAVSRDITARKQVEGDARFLAELTERLRVAEEPEALIAEVAESIGVYLRLQRCYFAEVDEGRDRWAVKQDFHAGLISMRGEYRLSDFPDSARDVLRAGRRLVAQDTKTDPSSASLYEASYAPLAIRAHADIPLTRGGQWVAALTAATASPRVWQPRELDLLEAIADRTWSAVEKLRLDAGLRKSEERFRTLFESMDEGYCVIQFLDGPHGPLSDYVHVLANPAYATNAGIPDIVGKKVREVVPGEAEAWVEVYRNVLITGEPVRFERELTLTGRHLELAAFRIGPPESRQVAVLFRDVTARKRAEETLRESEQRYRTIANELQATYDQSLIGMLQLDRDLRYVRINEHLAAMNGFPASAHLGKTIYEIIPDLAPKIETDFRRVMESGEPMIGMEIKGQTAADPGVEHTWLESWFPLRNPAGEIVGLNIVAQDVTSQRAAEQAIRESEERFRMLADNMAQLAWICDKLGNAIWYNQRWLDYTGFSFEEMGGGGWRQVQHPDHLDRVAARVQQSAETGEVWEDTFPLRGKDGQYRWFLSRAVPIRDEAGEIVRWFGTNTDITQQREAEDALKEADRLKDEFLATLAHELRNPLAPIRSSIHILSLQAQGDATIGQLSEMLDRQVNHMVRLVDDLMEISRISRGKIELRKEETSLAAIIRSAVDTSNPLIAAAKHQLAISLPPEPVALHGDPVRLAQVVSNLLNNAAKYTEPGGQIWLTAERQSREVVIRVRDNGIGIAREFLPRVFDMFMQVDRSSSRSQSGLGIGLTLVKRLVEMHGGTIKVRSDGPGTGSEFCVRLPCLNAPASATPVVSDSPRGATIKRRVLVVDDNRDAASSLGMLIKVLGSEVKVANDGATALSLLEAYQPDVVILDLGMPLMDGYEVARRIRELPRAEQMVLIALTGWGQEDARERTRAAGFDHHLVKPASMIQLQSLLSEL